MSAAGDKTYKKKCPVCLRKREEAIREQVLEGKTCGHRLCAFKKEIQEALKKKSQFKINDIKSPEFTIEDLKDPKTKIRIE